jgi:hypothetical protein
MQLAADVVTPPAERAARRPAGEASWIDEGMKRHTNSIIGLMAFFIILLQSNCAECEEGLFDDPAITTGLVAGLVSSFVCSAVNVSYMSHGAPNEGYSCRP